jgi:tripartite-type tricarboxylate transporter receptor subunit TctC
MKTFSPGTVAALIVLFAVSTAARAQRPDDYPSKPIRVIVPFSPGGPIDVLGRLLTQKLTEMLGVSVILDNRPGANGIIGTELVARSPRDGYTMLFTTGSHSANVSIYKKLPYDSLRDFAPITLIARGYGQVLVVHPAVPVKTVKDLVALAKKQPGKLNYASAGVGNATHLAAELLLSAARIEVTHVPYKGGGPALNDVLAGQIDMMFPSVAQIAPFIKDGRVRAVAISGPTRAPIIPEVPTYEESGYPGVVFAGWQGLWFPAGTPGERVHRMQNEIAKALANPEFKKRIDDIGLAPVGNTPEAFAAFLEGDIALHAKIVKAAHIAPQ